MNITSGDFTDPRILAFIEQHKSALQNSFLHGRALPLDMGELQKPEISFFVGWQDKQPVVIGIHKDLGAGAGEIKSLFVAEGHSGKGYGKDMLLHIVAFARRRCHRRLSLETGSGFADLEPGWDFYDQLGFKSGGSFGGYEHNASSQFLYLNLGESPLQTTAHSYERKVMAN